MILVRAYQLLNITITKTGLDLLQRLSLLFNDVYNKRLPPTEDDDEPMLSLFNATGQEILIENFDGLEVCFQNLDINFSLFIYLVLSLSRIHHHNQLLLK